ncbi:HNH endonuclease [Bacillaceae bacterium Marseille-Q3522]|nr:HNH endonuclease [Bacillaceae bacterium Marseille-Q3522]
MDGMNRNRLYDKYKRDQEARAFYKSTEWKKCRQLALDRDNHLCQQCLRNGELTPADMVHHIKELSDHPELGLVLDNLESLCNSCHNEKHSKNATKKVSKKVKFVKSQKNPKNT